MRTMKSRTCALLSVLVGAGCGGDDGAAGPAGADGPAGQETLVSVDTASTEQCPSGGFIVRTGRDTNGDGTLQEDEVNDEAVLCEAAPAEPGASGEDADCRGRAPVVVSAAELVEEGPYWRGAPYTLRVETAGEDVELSLVGSDVSLAGDFAAAGDAAYEASVVFEATGTRSLAVVASDGCTLDVAQLAVPSVLLQVELNAGYRAACAIVDPPAALECWGHEDISTDVPEGDDFVQVALSKGGNNPHACARRSNGSIACWGNDTNGSVEDANDAAGTYREVAVQATATCGVLEADGTLECWGSEDWYGRSSALAHEGPLSGMAMAPEYYQRTCAIDGDQQLVCWDSGLDSGGAVSGPNGSTETYGKVAVTGSSTCAQRTSGQLDCWGSFDALAGESVRDVGALTQGFCIVAEDGTLACDTSNAEVGNNVPTGDGFLRVDGGHLFACALHESSKILCWGDNAYGQLDLPSELALLP